MDEEMRVPLPCFACGKALESVFASMGKHLEQPADAVTFHTHGQYGSTAFDPQDGSQIKINICDPCLIEHKDRVRHVQMFSKPWDPGVTR